VIEHVASFQNAFGGETIHPRCNPRMELMVQDGKGEQ
jgi:hypothetical protein